MWLVDQLLKNGYKKFPKQKGNDERRNLGTNRERRKNKVSNNIGINDRKLEEKESLSYVRQLKQKL